jgi:DNA-3-methyladenine glycosylase II
MPPDSSFSIEPRGPFTLAAAARFIAGWPPASKSDHERGENVVQLGFLVDDWSGQAGVVLRQDDDGTVRGEIVDSSAADPGRIRAQAARILSLDHDATGYAEVGHRDPVVGELQRASGWLRPVLFHSPYEAACWAIISSRLRQPVAAQVRDRLAAEHGGSLSVAGREFSTFPAPKRLLAVSGVQGLSQEKLRRLHAIAHAALEGRLDRERLLALEPEQAIEELLELPGIGPFYSHLVLLRAVGPTDVMPLGEPRLRTAAAERYQAPQIVSDDDAFRALAEQWRPFRTWVGVLLRAGT